MTGRTETVTSTDSSITSDRGVDAVQYCSVSDENGPLLLLPNRWVVVVRYGGWGLLLGVFNDFFYFFLWALNPYGYCFLVVFVGVYGLK